MRKMLLSLLAVGTTLAVATPALARDNCGRGYHRIYKGRCVPNRYSYPVARSMKIVVPPCGW